MSEQGPEQVPDQGPEQLPGGRHGLSREEVLRSQRERLLDATVQSAVERGFQAMTVADVIRRAGVSRRTFYEMFADKEEAFLSAYDAVIDILVHEVESAYREQTGTWPRRVRAGVQAMADLLAANAAVAHMAMVEATAASQVARQRYRDALTRFTPFLDEGRGVSEFAGRLPANTSRIAIGSVAALLFDEVRGGRAEQLSDLVPDLLFAVVLPFLGREVAVAERQATIAAAAGSTT
ncbi:MAG TPA: TetR/AcrR family transcriptional regulator [Solirubrobacterales bacterium]|nr:TetR/AcrR family transcriptional regulator [Solirubrobacterales bacterium]